MNKKNSINDIVRGSIFGGAVGDALGYTVEFWDEDLIFSSYGETGITEYDLNLSRVARISDDTQMTLFTANALIFAMNRQNERGISADPRHYALYAYLGWLVTQTNKYSDKDKIPDDWRGWASYILKDVPELYSQRAPGMTCLSALRARNVYYENNIKENDFIKEKINDSKGCGGVMRVAPLGLAINSWDIRRLNNEGAQLAAITHGHSLGYIPAAILTHILHRIVFSEMTLKEIVIESRNTAFEMYKDDDHIKEMTDIIDLAISLSENECSDLENIHRLGEGWVAEETLAIAIYCALKYQNDFSKAVIAAVNHKGDSDSTGAVTGNIVGALVGYDAIESKWKENLELSNLILKVSDELCKAFCN